jgi:DNA-binding HxlR family transcriptional regulator
MNANPRSGCPINLTLEVVGDAWSLLVLRDMMFGGRRHFRELLLKSQEGISSNILADRLKTLLAAGVLTKADDPTHKQKAIYSLTEKGIQLLPVLAQLSSWGLRFEPVTPDMAVRAQILQDGGQPLLDDFMDELRESHLGIPRPHDGARVTERLRSAYEEVVARRAAEPRAAS